MVVNTTVVTLNRVKIHHQRRIKIYRGVNNQLAQKPFLSITIIIILTKQKLCYHHILPKQKKKTKKTLPEMKNVYLITTLNMNYRFLSPENFFLPEDSP